MTCLVMGNIGSKNQSIVTIQKAAELGDNRVKYPVAYETISKKTYVDNVLIDTPDHNQLKKYIEEIETDRAIEEAIHSPNADISSTSLIAAYSKLHLMTKGTMFLICG